MKKSKLVRWGIALLLLVTFLSRPVMTALTPVVSFSVAKDGEISFMLYGRNSRWHAQEQMEIGLPMQLSGAMRINKIFVSELDIVEEGQPLLSFEPVTAENLLYAAEKNLFRCEQAIKTLEDSTQNEEDSIKKQLSDPSVSDEDKAKLNRRLRESGPEYQAEMAFLERDRQNAQAEYDALLALKNANWQITSPCDGFIGSVSCSEGAFYSGIDPLLTLYVPNETVFVSAEVDADDNFEKYGMRGVVTGPKISIDRLPVTYKLNEGVAEVTVGIPYADAKEIWGNVKLEIECVDTDSRLVIPVGALIGGGNSVYVIAEQQGFWGTEYVLESRTVLLGANNGRQVAVRSGLQQGERVVLMSDRPVMAGDKVLLN